MQPKNIALLSATGLIAILGIYGYTQTLHTLDSANIAVFQRPFTGTLEVKTAPGTYLSLGSKITEYPRRDLFEFKYGGPKNPGTAIRVRYNDGGHAYLGGNISWEMPLDEPSVLKLHQLYGSYEAIEVQLISPSVNRAMYLTAPLMSSTESYAARRNDFLQIFADQLEFGVYKTESVDVRAPDPITNEMRTVKVVKVLHDKDGSVLRAEIAPLKTFNVKILPPAINDVIYDDDVEKQIQKQRDNIMQIQTAQAEAKKAEQQAITAAKNGEAGAMQAKWDQEVIKAKEVTRAEQEMAVQVLNSKRDKEVQVLNANRDKEVAEIIAQRALEVARLDAQSAAQEKQANIFRGEGEAARRTLVMTADGALERKLEAYVETQKMWAAAFRDFRGAIVPTISTNGGTGGTNNAAADFMSMIGMKAAKDLALEMSITGQPVQQPATIPVRR
jgi:hypothetical protein